MKTKEELNELKAEIEKLKMKLEALSEDELNQVIGGGILDSTPTADWIETFPERNREERLLP